MLGLVKIKDLQHLNLLDLTSPEEMKNLFPECADSPLFAEIFQKGETYYTLNHKMYLGGKSFIPAEFIIARLLIIFRIHGEQSFFDQFKKI